MSLKILVFPVFIILSLTIIIGYIKPDVMMVLAKRTELTQKKADLARVDMVIQNIRRLNAEISELPESENFVLKYLPRTLEEERVLDTFNFLASQSGLIVTKANIKENEPLQKEIPQVVYASSSFQALADAKARAEAEAMGVIVAPPTKTIHSYTGSVTVLGSYQSLKDFFIRLARTDRYHETLSYKIGRRDEAEDTVVAEGEVQYPSDFLEGEFEASFVYYEPTKITSALDMPLFQASAFDFSAVDRLLAFVNNPLPTLEVETSGRLNPFQP